MSGEYPPSSGSGARAEQLLRALTEGTSGVAGNAFFCALVRSLADALRVRRVFVAECPDNFARSRAVWMGHDMPNFEYNPTDTPCMKVTSTYEQAIKLGKLAFDDDVLPPDMPEELVRAILAARRPARD